MVSRRRVALQIVGRPGLGIVEISCVQILVCSHRSNIHSDGQETLSPEVFGNLADMGIVGTCADSLSHVLVPCIACLTQAALTEPLAAGPHSQDVMRLVQ